VRIDASGVSFSVGGRTILAPTDLSLKPGETCVLLGPNGAGKSTLMKIISGYLRPSTGSVALDDHPLRGLSIDVRAKKLGVLTQRSELDFPFTAKEVVALGRSPHGESRAETEIVDHLIGLLGIDAEAVYTHLSGGERQLVQVARVFAQIWGSGSTAYLLLDEPMTALDLKHQQDVVRVLRQLAQSGLGLLIVMHDINMAADIADRILLMREGGIIAAGHPAEVLTEANLAATFDTSMVLLRDGDSVFFKAGEKPGRTVR
jgi:iron complex transport system ATP-binding protein